MARHSDTKDRVMDAAARLFRRQGYAGTGLKQLVAEGGAPWGSLYHHFPGGKEDIAAQALARSGERYQSLIASVFARHADPVDAVAAFFQLMIDSLERSGYADGCPIATVTLETASTTAPLRAVCSDVLSAWVEQIARELEPSHGPRAPALATFVLAAFEGAMMLSRAHHDTTPLATTRDLVLSTLNAGTF